MDKNMVFIPLEIFQEILKKTESISNTWKTAAGASQDFLDTENHWSGISKQHLTIRNMQEFWSRNLYL